MIKANILRLIKPTLQTTWIADLSFAIIRVLCGLGLSVGFGADKFGVPWTPDSQNLKLFEVSAWFPQDVAEFGGIFAIAPVFFAWMGAFSEAVGGVLLALGIATRINAFLIVSTMLVAIFYQHSNAQLWNLLPAISFLWVGIYNLFLGSGRFGIDHLIT